MSHPHTSFQSSLSTRPGRFGRVEIWESRTARFLSIAGQIQGGSLLLPPASAVFADCPPGPGPIPASSHSLVWTLPAQLTQRGRGLMLGLGAGDGVVAALCSAQGITLDVIEIDPAVVELTLEHFPLVKKLGELGRLRVIVGDASEFLRVTPESYDFVILDINEGANRSPSHFLAREFLGAIRARSAQVWVNHIGAPDNPSTRGVESALAEAGLPVRSVLSLLPETLNTILTTHELRAPATGWRPLAALPESAAVAAARQRIGEIVLQARARPGVPGAAGTAGGAARVDTK